MGSPTGYSKTNNPVEQFNRDIKRDYTLRSLVSLNTLAQLLLDLSKHRSVRAKPFERSPCPSNEEVSRYMTLAITNRLVVSSIYRNSIAFIAATTEPSREFRVRQHGSDSSAISPCSTHIEIHAEEMKQEEQDMECDQQPANEWLVSVDDGTCGCRCWYKNGYCIHLIACGVSLDLVVDGLVRPPRNFVDKPRKKSKGRVPQIGHALGFE